MSKKVLKGIVKQFDLLSLIELNALSVRVLMAIHDRHEACADLAHKEKME